MYRQILVNFRDMNFHEISQGWTRSDTCQ